MSNRIWILAAAVICIAVIGLGYFVGVAPKLTEASQADAERVAIDQQNAIYESDLAALIEQFENIDAIRAELEVLQRSLPADDGGEQFIRQLDVAAAANAVAITEYLQETPVVYGDFAAEAVASPEAAAPLSGGTLLGIPFTLKVTSASPDALFAFLGDVQAGERLFVVSKLDLVSAAEGKAVTYTLSITGYGYTLADPTTSAVDPAAVTPPVEPVPEETTPAPESTATTTP